MELSPQTLAAAQAILAQHASQALATTHKDVPSRTPTTYYAHGPGGLFSSPALERPLFSAMVLPRQGVLARLPVRENRYASPLYGIITGVTASSGSEPTGPCDDPPVAGLLKLCTQSVYFGRQSRMSRVFELDRMGLLQDRGEHLDLQWVGNPLSPSGTGAQAPTLPGFGGGNAAVNSEVGKALMEMAVAWSRDFAEEVYTGNPSANTAGGGRKYYRGLDLLINTGYRDALTGVACAAADSIVRSAGNVNISTDVTGARTIFRTITDIFRQLQFNATSMGLAQVKWVIAMRPTLFYELTEVWPMVYATTRGLTLASSSTPIVSTAEYLNEQRDTMRGNLYEQTGQYLLIDGQRVEVVLDSAIAETNVGGGVYSSGMYFIPLTVLGGTVVTELEYLPYVGERSAMEAARAFGAEAFYQTTDNGRFLWHFKPPNNFCVQFLAKTEPRIVLRTPFLAARYTTIRYTPVSHERDWDPADTYFVNGGQTTYTGITPPAPSYFTPTS